MAEEKKKKTAAKTAEKATAASEQEVKAAEQPAPEVEASAEKEQQAKETAKTAEALEAAEGEKTENAEKTKAGEVPEKEEPPAEEKAEQPEKEKAVKKPAVKKADDEEKEKNFISAVVYVGDEKKHAVPFLKMLTQKLSARFQNYELVFVDDLSCDGTVDEIRKFLQKMEDAPPVTMIHMSLKQGLEPAMNAGLDMAVGDFVYEFDTMEMPWPKDMLYKVYDTCLEGNDIVTVSPAKNRSVWASLFYKVFNSSSKSKYPLHTDVFRILSRRAINRVHSISASMPYRKAAYASSGLKIASLKYDGKAGGAGEHLKFTRALDSLTLYTELGGRVSMFIAVFMLVLMIASLVYTLVVAFGGAVQPVPGWITTMLLLTGGFFGVFLILALVLKFLSLLVEMVFRKQTYLIESVEKIS